MLYIHRIHRIDFNQPKWQFIHRKTCIRVTIYCGNIDPLHLVSGSTVDDTYIHTGSHTRAGFSILKRFLWASFIPRWDSNCVFCFSNVQMCKETCTRCIKVALFWLRLTPTRGLVRLFISLFFRSVVSNERWQTDSEATQGRLECGSWTLSVIFSQKVVLMKHSEKQSRRVKIDTLPRSFQ